MGVPLIRTLKTESPSLPRPPQKMGDFTPTSAKRQESQQEQLELQLQEFKADIVAVVADVKATVASLQANPVPQTSQLAELKDIREELQALKDS